MERRGFVVLLTLFLVVIAGCTGISTPDSNNIGEPDSPTEEPVQTATAVAGNGTLDVHFINVGQSVSTLIVGPTGETMLIDTGDFTDDGEYVLEYLQEHNIERIDYMITSHNDADHIGGNAAVIEYYETESDGIGAIYDPGISAGTETYTEYLDAVETHDVTLYETREGDSIPFEGVDVSVLGPPAPYIEDEARNENSIVLKLQFGQTTFLFPGDAEDDQEEYLVENYGSGLESTVLKAGHHGSKSSSTGAFLDAVDPQAVVISSAYDSRYDHPNEETLQRLAERSLRTYWTATHGTVVFVSNGNTVEVQTQREAPTDPRSLRDGSAIEPGTSGTVQTRALLTGEAVATPVLTDGGTDTAGAGKGKLVIEEIHADAAGDESSNLNDEYVVFRNDGSEALDLSGWTVEDEAGKTYTFADGFSLDPGATVTLHTGTGTDGETNLYWGSGSAIWNNAGDTVIVTNSEGAVVLEESY